MAERLNRTGEALRAQLSRLPDMPKPQQLDKEITDLRVERLKYENMLDALSGNNNEPDTSQTASSRRIRLRFISS